MPYQPWYDVPAARQAYTYRAEGSSVGVLMLHGFMGSPLSSRALSEYLNRRGITIHCPLLPGHGHYPDKYAGITHQDWLAEAEEGLQTLRGWRDEIFLMGHSMGNVLAARLTQLDDDIRGMVMLAPTYDVPDKRLRWLRLLRYVMPWFPAHKIKKTRKIAEERIVDYHPDFDFDAPDAEERIAEIARMPTSGIDEMRKTLDLGKSLWGKVSVPAIILQGTRDVAIFPNSGEIICQMLGSPDKELKLFKKAGHELMRPFSKVHGDVWETVYQFIARRTDQLPASTQPRSAPA